MIKKLSVLAVGALLGFTAQAAFITGSLGTAGTFGAGGIPIPPPNTTSIVSALTSFNLDNVQNVFQTGVGAFSTVNSVSAFDVLPPALPTTFYTTTNGFTFTVTSFTNASRTALSCTGQLCVDASQFLVSGFVTGAGFDPTVFIGNWSANGSCIRGGDGTNCGSNVVGTYNATLTATGEQAILVPEPSMVALVGLGLAGVGFSRRRKA
jgi:PEP-CTERM motif